MSTGRLPSTPESLKTLEDISAEIADRLGSPPEVKALVAGQQGGLNGVEWHGPSLGNGHAGISLFLLERAKRTGMQSDYDAAFDHLRAAVSANNEAPSGALGLFSGAAGLSYAMTQCANQEPRFAPSAERFHERVADSVLDVKWDFKTRRAIDQEFDLISGASGVLLYLVRSPQQSRTSRVAIDHLSHYLGWLLTNAPLDYTFFRSPDNYVPGGTLARQYPRGAIDCSLSHGISSVTLALSATEQSGQSSIGLQEPLRRVRDWLAMSALQAGEINFYPSALGEAAGGAASTALDYSWCRGSSGIVAAHSAASDATGDVDGARNARQGARAAFENYDSELRPGGPSYCLCHGAAGVAIMAQSLGLDTGVHERDLGLAFDPELPTGYAEKNVANDDLYDPSFLSGSAGVGAAAEHLLTRAGTWTRDLGFTLDD
jgi:hypothetical protein